jgi:polysaccharide export outer membrane protein
MRSLFDPRCARDCVAGALALFLGACVTHGTGPFTWVDELPATEIAPTGGEYRLSPGDLVAVQIFNHPEMSGRTRVRDDGEVSIPLLGDVSARDRSPTELARAIETELGAKNLAVAARASIALEERAQLKTSVLGEVLHPGVYVLEPSAGVAQALASAGGFTEFAHRDRIFVVRRQSGNAVRIRIRYQDLSRASGQASALQLRPGDVVVVE